MDENQTESVPEPIQEVPVITRLCAALCVDPAFSGKLMFSADDILARINDKPETFYSILLDILEVDMPNGLSLPDAEAEDVVLMAWAESYMANEGVTIESMNREILQIHESGVMTAENCPFIEQDTPLDKAVRAFRNAVAGAWVAVVEEDAEADGGPATPPA